MDVKTTLLLMILRMFGQRAESARDLARLNNSRPAVQQLVGRAHTATIEILAATRAEHAEQMASWKHGQPRPAPFPVDLTTAVGMKESSLRAGVVGKAGERSYMQVKPDGLALLICPDLLDRLDQPRENIVCGIRLLRDARRRCGPDPIQFLGWYNGTRGCRETTYAARVLAILEAAKLREVASR